MTTLTRTFSIKNGLDVANTIVLDSNRNLSNIAIANANTVNASYFITSAGLNVTGQANAAYDQANAAYNQANAAYNAANTSSGGVRVAANTGLMISSNTLVFNNTSTISVNVSQNGANANISFDYNGGDGFSIFETNRFTGTGACTTFTLLQVSSTKKTFVYIDGVSQKPEVDFQVVNKTLTFNVAPPNTASIEARTVTDVKAGNVSSIISDKFTGTGSCTEFTISTAGIVDNTAFVFIDGVTQVPTTDYSISGNTITFSTPPESNAVIELRGFTSVRVFEESNSIVETNSTFKITTSALEFYSNGFTTSTDSISRTYILRGTTVNGTESEIFLVNGARIPVAANSTVFYTADIVGRRIDSLNESCGFYIKGVADNFSGTVADVGNLYEIVVAEDDADWAVDARADDTNNSINIYVTGESAKTIRWTALVRTVEVAG